MLIKFIFKCKPIINWDIGIHTYIQYKRYRRKQLIGTPFPTSVLITMLKRIRPC